MMRNSLKSALFFLLTALPVLASFNKHFPLDDYDYRPGKDRGLRQYQAFSLHGKKELVLTFDDGPNLIQTPKVLDLLKTYKAKATFFINTVNLNKFSLPLAHRILKEGHILASHDYNHRNNNEEDENLFREDLLHSLEDIKKLENDHGLHQKGLYFRFPYGAYGQHPHYHHLNAIRDLSWETFGENCINFAFWDIDTKDWGPTMTSKEIAQNVLAHMEGGMAFTVVLKNNKWVKQPFEITKPPRGGVVLLHDKRDETIEGTRLILEMAKQKNWRIIPLDQVKEFSFKNKKCRDL
jgi:peptidoglycan/xylan/chitin deacetylase (PgdA/CDA1 family)